MKADNTRKILNRERGGKDEWTRLHALICFVMDCPEVSNVIDTVTIAARCDEVMEKEAEKRILNYGL